MIEPVGSAAAPQSWQPLEAHAPSAQDMAGSEAARTDAVTQPQAPRTLQPGGDLATVVGALKALAPKLDVKALRTLPQAPPTSEMPELLSVALEEMRRASTEAIAPGLIVTAVSSAASSVKRLQQGQ